MISDDFSDQQTDWKIMSSTIYWVVTCTVKPGKFADFKKVISPLAATTKQEAGSISYDFSVSEDQNTVHIFEHYTDSAAIVHHVTQTLSQFLEAFGACASIDELVVYGTPEGEAKQILDGLGSVYFTPFDGFMSKN